MFQIYLNSDSLTKYKIIFICVRLLTVPSYKQKNKNWNCKNSNVVPPII